jgi:hypothetical protein
MKPGGTVLVSKVKKGKGKGVHMHDMKAYVWRKCVSSHS